jgi:hypothetical protein
MAIGMPLTQNAFAEKAALQAGIQKVNITVGGVYNVWGLSQNNFFLGAKGPGKEKDDYIVQMLRLKVKLADKNEDIKVVTRFDLAQGWFGVDNAGNQNFNKGQFYNKGTFFDVHIDHAYLDFKVPVIDSTRIKIGRMHFSLGNKLVLDDDVDGGKIVSKVGPGKITLSYGKFFEGDTCINAAGLPIPAPISAGGACDPALASLNDRGNAGDANMAIIQYDVKSETASLNTWYLYYHDGGTSNGTAYITNGLGYNRPKFTPQVSTLHIVGASGKVKVGALSIKAEGDYLKGSDRIKNTTYNHARNDINNGSIDGETFYVDAKYDLTSQVNLGVKFGYGSGDSNPNGGKGNITKLKTQGFFYFTEVWEDSIMPDVAGITPQGLGAPNTQGYREFENTTAIQVYGNYRPVNWLNLFVSYSYLKATKDVRSWSKSGVDTIPDGLQRSNKLGQEIDAIVSAHLYKNLVFQLRGGYFLPGDATKLLINGNLAAGSKKAWEGKSTLTYKF